MIKDNFLKGFDKFSDLTKEDLVENYFCRSKD